MDIYGLFCYILITAVINLLMQKRKAAQRPVEPDCSHLTSKMETPGYWSTLGISPTFDKESIKAAYRQRIKENHPDLHGPEYTHHCARINEAYKKAIEAAS